METPSEQEQSSISVPLDPPIAPQQVQIISTAETNAVSVVQYDDENKIANLIRFPGGPVGHATLTLQPGWRCYLVACSPREHDELVENQRLDQTQD